MITKDRNPNEHPAPDRYAVAGAKAEDQMAFYLKRAFGSADDKDVFVFNDLRLANDRGDDFAQIDHLVLYRRGMVLIESKSVTSKVAINTHGEWSRHWDGAWKGMESPIRQAKRQAQFLKDLLNSHAEELRGKMALLGLQIRFNACPFDVIVAISDQGSIDRGRANVPEVMKAEAVVDEITRIIAKHRLGLLTPSLDMNVGAEKFSDTEMLKIRDFLKRRHTPLVRRPADTVVTPPPKPPMRVADRSPRPEPAPPRPANQRAVCRKCQGTTVNVEYGKFGYYLKCRDCDGNTPIDLGCPCGQKARIRKERERFFKECKACGASALWHVNT